MVRTSIGMAFQAWGDRWDTLYGSLMVRMMPRTPQVIAGCRPVPGIPGTGGTDEESAHVLGAHVSVSFQLAVVSCADAR